MESNESTEQWLASRQHDLPPVIVRLRYPPNKRCIAPRKKGVGVVLVGMR